MIRLVTSQLDEFETTLRGVHGRYVSTKSTTRDWRLRIIDLDAIQITLVRFGSDCIFRGAFSQQKFALSFPLSRSGYFSFNGIPLNGGAFAWLTPEQEFHAIRNDSPRSLTIAFDMRRLSHLPEVYPLLFSASSNMILRANPDAFRNLLALVRQMLHADTVEPLALRSPMACNMACRQLLDAVYPLMDTAQPLVHSQVGRRPAERQKIIHRALELIDQRIGETIQLNELCEATAVSERTLHAAFVEYFGVSPHRYLMLHRLRAIHSDMRAARPMDTVASICSKYGVWDFGRFSALYRRTYGALPSATLAKALGA